MVKVCINGPRETDLCKECTYHKEYYYSTPMDITIRLGDHIHTIYRDEYRLGWCCYDCHLPWWSEYVRENSLIEIPVIYDIP